MRRGARTGNVPPSLANRAAALLGVLGAAATAHAGGAGPPLRIDCPVLDLESQAALEARARAEMALTPLPAGEIAISCERHRAHVGWRAVGGGLHQREVGLGADPAVAVDSLLGAVHALRFDDAGAVAVAAAAPPETVVAQPSRPPASPPPRGAVAVTGQRVGLGVLLGLHSELWEGAMAGVIEAHLGLRVSWRGRWSLAAAGGLGQGLETAEGIRARTWRAMLSLGYLAGAHLDLRAGGEWRSISPALAGAVTAAPRRSTSGAFVAARYVVSDGRFRLAAGPQLDLATAPILVDLDGREVFRLPRLAVGFSLTGEGDIIH